LNFKALILIQVLHLKKIIFLFNCYNLTIQWLYWQRFFKHTIEMVRYKALQLKVEKFISFWSLSYMQITAHLRPNIYQHSLEILGCNIKNLINACGIQIRDTYKRLWYPNCWFFRNCDVGHLFESFQRHHIMLSFTASGVDLLHPITNNSSVLPRIWILKKPNFHIVSFSTWSYKSTLNASGKLDWQIILYLLIKMESELQNTIIGSIFKNV
jgi:hypothetical protein